MITEIIPKGFLINIVAPPNSNTYKISYKKGGLFVNSDESQNDFHVTGCSHSLKINQSKNLT
jgi:hypothetical protein